jgi:hypothetical protein
VLAIQALNGGCQIREDVQGPIGYPVIECVGRLVQFVEVVGVNALEDEVSNQKVSVLDQVTHSRRLTGGHLGQRGSHLAKQQDRFPDLANTGGRPNSRG